jgi:hypothetical protein
LGALVIEVFDTSLFIDTIGNALRSSRSGRDWPKEVSKWCLSSPLPASEQFLNTWPDKDKRIFSDLRGA